MIEFRFNIDRAAIATVNWIKNKIGFIYSDHNYFQLEIRLKKYIEKHDIQTENQLLGIILNPTQKQEDELVELLVNNETYFFREPNFFKKLEEELIPELVRMSEDKHIRICNLACSSGQEVYSTAFACERAKAKGLHFEYSILGADVSKKMLDLTQSGIYNSIEVSRGLEEEDRKKYLTEKGDLFHVIEPIKKRIKTAHVNLNESILLQETFDLILCRNVLYYLEKESKDKTVGEVNRLLSDHGIFVLSGTENLMGYEQKFKMHESTMGCYVKSDR